jgi:uncharacterized membrane protein HdeD (DUF308 family)
MNTVHNNRGILIFEGVLFILLGLLAIGLPGLFTLGFELTIGWIFLIAGGVQIYRAIRARELPGFGMALGSGVLSLLVGVLLIAYPLNGILTLTILLTIFFLLEGIIKIAMGFQMRPIHGWGWVIFSGVISLIMGGIIVSGWPQTAIWVIGLLVGINMLFYGFSLLSLVFSAPQKV